MFSKVLINALLVSISILCSSSNILAWSDKITHRGLSEKAFEYSVLNQGYLKNIGFNETTEFLEWVKKQIRDGAIEEDAGNVFTAYYYNHFHNPLALSWDQAGLSTIYPFINGKSSLLWAQDNSNPWSWQKAREYYYKALSSTAAADRNANFEQTFKGVGHIIHLIQDSAQPAHVRDDIHPVDDRGDWPQFEYWAKNSKNQTDVSSFMLNPVFPSVFLNTLVGSYVPITQFWDTDQYNGSNPPSGTAIGISEYTNANFFSEDTIYLGSFPYPDITQTTITERTAPNGNYQRQYYLKNCCGETNGGQGYLLSAVDYLDYYRQQYPSLSAGLPKIPILDNNVYRDYASLLLPRAVGYSAGLLNYFFRGTLEITAPDTYVYSIIDGSINPQQFTKIKAKVRNTTPNEQIQNGILQAIAKYKKRTDYQPDLSTDPPTLTSREPEFSYSVSAQWTLSSTEISSLNAIPTEFTFNFENSPIPAGITDLYLIVIFKGTLGNEIDTGIAAGKKDIIEPTHHVIWNLTDMVILHYQEANDPAPRYHLYTENQIRSKPELLNIISQNNIRDAYLSPHDMTIRIAYLNNPPDPNNFIHINPIAEAVLPGGRHIRLIILLDREDNNYMRVTSFDSVYDNNQRSFLPWGCMRTDTLVGAGDDIYNGQYMGTYCDSTFSSLGYQERDGLFRYQETSAFRYYDENGQRISFKQHLRSLGKLWTTPIPSLNDRYYPDEESISANKTPEKAVINFP